MKKLILALILILLFLFWLFSLAGCNPTKKIEQAKQRVMLDKKAFDEVGRNFVTLHPCANDTAWKFIKGGTDSIPYPVIYFDSAAYKTFKDSLEIIGANDFNNGVEKAFVQGFDAARKQYESKKIAVPRADTLKGAIVDIQKERLLDDQINMLDVQVGVLTGQSSEKDRQLSEANRRYKKTMWWLIGLLVAITSGTIIYGYLKFKNPANIIKKVI